MISRRNAALFGTLLVGLGGLGLCIFFSHPNRGPWVQLPDGVSLAEISTRRPEGEPQGWFTNRFTPYTLRGQHLSNFLRFKMHELLGRSLLNLPNPAREVQLMRNLAECSSYSGDTYLLAKELFPAGYGPNWPDPLFGLSFVYGGTNTVRNAREWIALNEAGLVRNGVVAFRGKQPPPPLVVGATLNEPYATNQCAIVRDVTGFVKVVPIDCLPAYVHAGLLMLPSSGGK